MRADCVRCGTGLRRTRRDPLGRCLALSAAALVLFAVVWTAMLMKVSTAGIVHETTLASGPLELVRYGLWPLALVVAFTTALAPFVKYRRHALRAGRPARRAGRCPIWRASSCSRAAWALWAMLEVLMLGVFVAYTKLGDLVHVEVGAAVWALGLLTVVALWADAALDPDAVWEAIERRGQTQAPMPEGAPLDFRPGAVGCEACGLVGVPHEHDGNCPRCGSAVHARKPGSLDRTWAFVIAAAILYIPANVYPVLTVIQAGAGQPSTILGGVEELLASRMYPLALLVFFASILVPVFKLIGLAVMLMATMLVGPESGAAMLLRERTRLYYIVAWIGRWSMVDIFMELLLGALVQFGPSVTIEPGIGAVAFCAVVFITIFGAEAFDPRLMWDAAARNAHRPLPSGRAYPGTAAAVLS